MSSAGLAKPGTGQTVRVQAQNDTFVAGVHVVIADAQGNIFEQGEAQKADGLWWEYITTTQLSTEANPFVPVSLTPNSPEF